jgi:hypothetical protein
MVNLFDIMRNAEHGAALHNMARRFSLSPADTQHALDALLPLRSASKKPFMIPPPLRSCSG